MEQLGRDRRDVGREAGASSRARPPEGTEGRTGDTNAAARRIIEAVEIDEMTRDSPDGRPPTWRERRMGWVVLGAIVAIGVPTVLASVALVGGMVAAVVAGAFVLLFLLAGAPVLIAALWRKEEEVQIDRDVEQQIGGPDGSRNEDLP